MADTETTTEPEVVVKLEPAEVIPEKTGETAKKTGDAVQDLATQYNALEEKSKEDRAARDAALARAAEAEQSASAARRDADAARAAATTSNLDTITAALASAQSTLESAKVAKRAAREAGDFDAESEADDRIIQAKIDLRTYDEAKTSLEARKSAPVQTTPIDPVEAYVRGRSDQTAAWLRKNREFVIDPRKNAKLTAAHHDALAESITPDTKEYFEHVEKFIGLKKEEKPVTEGDDVQRPGAVPKKQNQRAVAPVNGASGTGGAVNSNEVRLSQREAAAATDGTHVYNYDDPSGQKRFKKGDPIGLEEFARRKKKLIEQGAYDRTYETQ